MQSASSIGLTIFRDNGNLSCNPRGAARGNDNRGGAMAFTIGRSDIIERDSN